MASSNSHEDNGVPLFGQREVAGFVFDPSDELAEQLWALARPSYRQEMGRKGLTLYSNSSVNVTRRYDGSLEPRDALMESAVHKIISEKPTDTRRRLARYISVGTVKDPKTDEVRGVRVNLRILLDMAMIKKMKDSNYIPDDELLDGSGVYAGLFVPIQQAMPKSHFKHRYEDLASFVHGPQWNPSMLREGLRTPSLAIGAFATNMRMISRGNRPKNGQS